MQTKHAIRNGPGLKIIGQTVWYGPGYCGICGSRDPVPQSVRYWDCDDGWRYGVLCEGCAEDCQQRGPQPDDYAVASQATDELTSDEKIDILADILGDDQDGIYSMADE